MTVSIIKRTAVEVELLDLRHEHGMLVAQISEDRFREFDLSKEDIVEAIMTFSEVRDFMDIDTDEFNNVHKSVDYDAAFASLSKEELQTYCAGLFQQIVDSELKCETRLKDKQDSIIDWE